MRAPENLLAFQPSDGGIVLRLCQYHPALERLGHAECISFMVEDVQTGQEAGQVALRIGDGKALFYLGHIGYHIDPPFRGNHYAARACRLCVPILQQRGFMTAVITTDIDNVPSIRTCEQLGCEYEETVSVPILYRFMFQLSARKKRYIWRIPHADG